VKDKDAEWAFMSVKYINLPFPVLFVYHPRFVNTQSAYKTLLEIPPPNTVIYEVYVRFRNVNVRF